MAMLFNARCSRCGTNVNARSQNYIEYFFGAGRHGIPCLYSIIHIVAAVLILPFWIGYVVTRYFMHGTRFFCVVCEDQLSESDILP